MHSARVQPSAPKIVTTNSEAAGLSTILVYPNCYTRAVFRPWLRVARPDDWTGTLARLGLWPVYLLALLGVGLARIPSAWVLWFEPLTRLLIGLVVAYLLGWVRMVAWALPPGAVIQYGRYLWFPQGRRRVRVAISDISAIAVEQRPPPIGETFVIELGSGDVTYDLCPVHNDGAERVYAAVARKVRRARIRADRRDARARRRGLASKKM